MRIQRREFITCLGATCAWPFAARAQHAAMPVVGFINGQAADTYAHLAAALRRGLSEGGFVVGQTVVIEERWANGQLDRLPALTADLVGRNVAVLVTSGSLQSTFAAKAATSSIPIVFITGSDPVKYGIVASLNRPGGNVTGVAFLVNQLGSKRLELMQKLIPGATRIGMIAHPQSPNTAIDVANAKAAAAALGQTLLVQNVGTEHDFEPAFATLVQEQAAALVINSDPFFNNKRDVIVALAAHHRLPAAYELREFVAAGGLMSYGTSVSDAYRQAGAYAARILKGEKPTDLPVVRPTKFELVINLKTAKTLGIAVPANLLALADEVIE